MSRVSIEQAMLLARQQVQAQNWRGAEHVLQQVLQAEPNCGDALYLLGGLAMHTGRLEMAVDLLRRTAAVQPNSADVHYNFGVALIQTRQPAEAAAEFKRAAMLKPDHVGARANFAGALVAMNRFEEGIDACRWTLEIAPDHPDAWNNLGVALQKLGRIDEAVVALERSVALRPDSAETLSNLANNLTRAKRYDEAIAAHRRAIALRPKVAELQNDLGCALYDAGHYEEAVEVFRRAMKLRPHYPQAQCTLAISLHRCGRMDEAIAEGREAIRQWPDAPLPKFNLSIMLLLRGEFEEGWRLDEARLDVPELHLPRPVQGKPVWDGSDLNGKTIVLYGEQGLGDFIQFIRYIPMVKERGGRIILGCAPELHRLAKQIQGIERLVTIADGDLDFDTDRSLLSLPGIFGTNLSNIPVPVPYLRADPELVSRWKSRMPDDPKLLKVGLCWAGRPTHGDDHNRSTTLATLAALGQVGGVWFCSLQKGDAAAQAKNPPQGMQIADFSDQIEDFADTAAIIENLDLVISVDTAVVHLAGAMGKPAWVLLPFVPDWRWLLDRSDSPWYPSLRLFRQPKLRDWQGAIGQVVQALRERVSSLH